MLIFSTHFMFFFLYCVSNLHGYGKQDTPILIVIQFSNTHRRSINFVKTARVTHTSTDWITELIFRLFWTKGQLQRMSGLYSEIALVLLNRLESLATARRTICTAMFLPQINVNTFHSTNTKNAAYAKFEIIFKWDARF